MKGGVGRIVLWTKVMTRMELDPEGAVRELDAQTWQEWHQRLKKLGGPPMPCPPGE